MIMPCGASISKWVGTIDRYSQIYFNRNLRKYGIGPGQLQFLMYLYDNNGISQDQFSKELFFDKGTVARALQALEEAGLARRIPSDTDRRKNLVYLTEKANEIRSEIKLTMDKWTVLLTKNMSKEEISILMLLLQKTSGNAIDVIGAIQSDDSDNNENVKTENNEMLSAH
jgi:DNA-binding MarR family transcriptional regulator